MTFQLLLSYFGINVIILLAINLIGVFTLKLLNFKIANFHLALFTRLTIGLTILICCYSAFQTRLITVNWGFLLICLPAVYSLRKSEIPSPEPASFKSLLNINSAQRKYLFYLFLGLVTIFILRVILSYDLSGNLKHQNHYQVFAYYANAAEFLNQTGIESSANIDWFLKPNHMGVDPYHYYEIWFIAAVAKVFGLLPLIAELFIVIPIGLFIVMIGFISLIESILNKKISLAYLLCFFMLLCSGFYIGFYNSFGIINGIHSQCWSVYTLPKLFPLYIFFIISIHFALKKNYELLFYSLIAICLINILALAPVYGSLFLYSCLAFFFPTLRYRGLIKNLIVAILVIIFLLIFYTVFRGHFTEIPEGTFDLKELMNNFSTMIAITEFGKVSIHLFIAYLPYLIILFLAYHFNNKSIKNIISSRKKEVIIYFSMLFISAFFSSFFYFILDMNQMVILISSTIIQIGIFTMIFFFVNNIPYSNRKTNSSKLTINRALVILSSMIFIIVAELHYSPYQVIGRYSELINPLFLKNVRNEIDDMGCPRGVFMYDQSEYLSIDQKNYNFSYPTYFLNFLVACPLISISVNESPQNETMFNNSEQALLKKSFFNNYIFDQKLHGKFRNIPESRNSFIEQYGMTYLITSKKVILDTIMLKIIDQNYFDSISGQHFYTFRGSK